MLSHPNNASLVNIQSIHVDYFALIVMLVMKITVMQRKYK